MIYFKMFYIFSIETFLLLFLVLVLIRLYINKRWSLLKKLNIPHEPPSIFTLGNLGDTMKDPDNIFAKDDERKKKFGYIYGAYVGLHPRIVISDPKILKQIFIKEFSNFRDRQDVLRKCNGKELNNGVFQAGGEQWKRLRHSLSPTFSASKLREMSPIIESCVSRLLDNLSQAAKENNGRFNAKKTFGSLSMDTMCSAAFSTDVHSQHSSSESGGKLMKMAQKLFQSELFKNPLIFLFVMFPKTEILAEKFDYSVFGSDTMKFFRRLVDSLIERKEQYTKEKRVDIMQTMLEQEVSEDQIKKGLVTKGLTRTEIVGNSMLMLLAGYETTGNSMIFFAYNLATHPEIQEKLRQEVDETFENYGKLNYDAVNSMKYLTMCINESLRLYLPVARSFRMAEKDITIENIHIPAGITIDVPVWGMSHDEEYWDEPYEYKPDRMADMSKIDPVIFQPFGVGPRNCIGMRLALLEMKFAFSRLLRNFKLEVCEDTPKPPLAVTFKASMQPKQDISLKAVPREFE